MSIRLTAPTGLAARKSRVGHVVWMCPHGIDVEQTVVEVGHFEDQLLAVVLERDSFRVLPDISNPFDPPALGVTGQWHRLPVWAVGIL